MLEQVESLKPIAAIEARGKVVEPERVSHEVVRGWLLPAEAAERKLGQFILLMLLVHVPARQRRRWVTFATKSNNFGGVRFIHL